MIKTILTTFLKLAISGGLIAYILSQLDVADAVDKLTRLSAGMIAFGVAMVALHIRLSSWRWSFLIRRMFHERLSSAAAMALFVMGMFFGQSFLPLAAGDVIRAWGVHRYGMSLRNAVVGVALDTLTGLLGLALLAVLGLLVFAGLTSDTQAVFGAGLGVVVIFGATAALAVGDRVLGLLPQIRPVKGLAAVAKDARRLVLDPGLCLRLLAMTVLGHLIPVALVIAFASDIGEPVSPLVAFAIVPVAQLISAVPVSIAGWGVRETAMVVAFQLVGGDPVLALTLSILIGLMYLLVSLPGGLVWLVLFFRRGKFAPPRRKA